MMNHTLACADFTFPLLTHEKVLQLIAMLEFEGVDIGLFEGRSHLWPSREFVHTERSGGELKRKLDGLGLKTADVFLQMAPDFQPFALNHPEAVRRKKARDWFLHTLEYAAACDSKHVTTLPGVPFENESYADSYRRALDELAWRVEKAKAQSIIFGVEAHVGSLVPEPKKAERLVKDVPGLTLTLDYTHFTRIGLPDSEVEPLVPYASHFHLRGASPGRLQTSFQNNVIDYERVLQAMQSCRYTGWVGIEYVWIDWEQCNECDNLSETILFRDFVRRVLSS
jgi:sugar phosphate isomerase/epimerase